ncbi:galactose mutarotase-like isoform X1 [Hylaeus volcanicus]|uniref:galactose mutarotase-like isoform X1 n=2 Tax=Hylaeus volcanicus TaxID=313075 RepID=UPI0023B7C5D8|nr:galactose mutarotase-like isoform X1 [Hylaeus volcanicus]
MYRSAATAIKKDRIGYCDFHFQLSCLLHHVNMQFFDYIAIISFCLLGSFMDSSCEKLITVTEWGSIDGVTIKKYTLKNDAGQEVDVVTYGATITSIRTPDKQGRITDIVLGFDNVEEYSSSTNPYFGATVGRVANRIGKAAFTLNGKKYSLAKNAGENTLHGGFNGWSSKIWNSTIENNSLVLSLISEDGDEGFPGVAAASVSFKLTADGELRIDMKVVVTKPTPINLTNHSYFNLAGHESNATELYKHKITLNADRWTVTDTESIPTGEIRSVENTVMDLRNLTTLGDVIDKVPGGGYDYNFCLPTETANEKQFVARVVHPTSGRYLEVYSNQPGVQFYTANFLPERDGIGIQGKNGTKYFKHGALCLETQNYPDAVNHENFPNSIVEPGQTYHHIVIYKLGILH